MNQFFRLVYFLKYAKKETAIRILVGLGIVGAQFSQTWFLAKNGYSSMRDKKCERNSNVFSGRISFFFYPSRVDKVSGVFSEKICGESEE